MCWRGGNAPGGRRSRKRRGGWGWRGFVCIGRCGSVAGLRRGREGDGRIYTRAQAGIAAGRIKEGIGIVAGARVIAGNGEVAGLVGRGVVVAAAVLGGSGAAVEQ